MMAAAAFYVKDDSLKIVSSEGHTAASVPPWTLAYSHRSKARFLSGSCKESSSMRQTVLQLLSR